ncbi:phosphotriesterase [Saccharopolyspora hirsuta]|uniref:Aryldialkylphosphatase n=1 Tax=Saccharopolyspora hirsuta TaxID=1837 RepID=A0A5M7C5Z6_SACHI|nr:aryldialkylphosphatase [Saccharopolyspora hirsuta]KAA5835024.1 aryldialkylphosphatase [Saccharopolyspora hirsuta]
MTVRTVRGDIPAQALGRTDYHEHLFQISPLLPGDELDDEQRSGQEAQSLRAAGIEAMVEATPIGLGRDPAGMARIAERTGLHVVATTGAHRQAHYPDDHPLLASTEEELAERFTADLVTGMSSVDGSPTGVWAGLLKAGIGYWSISPFEHRVLAAVAAAHVATGAPVMVHLEHGSAAFEVLDELRGHGVRAERVVLAHADRNPDPGLHAELCAAGAYLGYDGIARHRDWPDSVILDCLLATAERGGADRLLLGGDVARRSRYRAYGGIPGLEYLPKRFLPRLVREGGAELADAIMRSNPARLLDWHA